MYEEVYRRMDELKNVLDGERVPQYYEYDVGYSGVGYNKIIYGTPGCGKSYYVDHVLLEELNITDSPDFRIRTVFHSEYSNTDFIGQIYPHVMRSEDGTTSSVSYDFKPGPFTIALCSAIEHPDDPVALVIEEINRGNAAAIFGEIFQLLDRDAGGRSRYNIICPAVQDYLDFKFRKMGLIFSDIRIPSNLYLIATMNTCDQSIFPMDTAFKRRWIYEKRSNTFDNHSYGLKIVPGLDREQITWKDFVIAVNEMISRSNEIPHAEDKLLGAYFVESPDLLDDSDCYSIEYTQKFAYKVLEYLWDDVVRYNTNILFESDITSLDELIEVYTSRGDVFNEIVHKHMIDERDRRVNESRKESFSGDDFSNEGE